MKPKEKPHYVNNKEFSLAVVEYVKEFKKAEEEGLELPKVPNYVAECFLKIAEGLSHKGNFVRYSYRDEMVMDAVENCLKAIHNYKIDAPTRTGTPNAFSYFTQICYYAFLHRIAREKKQQDIKMKYISQSPFEDFAVTTADEESIKAAYSFVDVLKSKIDQLKEKDTWMDVKVKEEMKKTKKTNPKKKTNKAVLNSSDSDLGEILK